MTVLSPLFDASELSALRRNVRRWYRRHGRNHPWRQADDPYRVWISEIMLQQTTVAAVVPYFERFLKRFPDVHTLAAADEEDVLRLWEGLGYYSRARNIHKTARRLVADWNGRFPEEVSALTALPGIGRYTAGAIASFAFDRPSPIVEANTLRLYCRLLGYDGDPRSTAGQRLLWALAEQLVPPRSPGEFNQALMDLGATVCTRADPECSRCPLRTVCRAAAEGRIAEIPRPPGRVAVTEVTEATVAVRKRGRYLLRRRSDSERWAGLWDFLRFEIPDAPSDGDLPGAVRTQLIGRIDELVGLAVDLPEPVRVLRHSVTRYRITLHCLRAVCRGGRIRRTNGPLEWVQPSAFDRYPLSVTGRKLARILAQKTKHSGCFEHPGC